MATTSAAVVSDPQMEGLPKRFGKYTLIRKLATGGMAELFLAIQKSVAGFEKLIVIKRILPQMNQDRAFIDMLLHEARVAATLSHPNIVQIFDVGAVDGIYFIAMEHVHGEDLRSIVRQMKKKGVSEFPIEHALSILLGMCAGLAYAHEQRDLDGSPLNIVHRDISPQNVVITFSGDVKIVDFGIAKSDSKLQAADTKSGRLKGKIPYMSPEQARGEVVDWRSDIFAAGVMLFELTTGKRLFKGPSEFETLKLICERDYPRPSQVRAGYPMELEKIVVRALQKSRTDRYQSAREMQADLEEFVRRERIPVSTIALSQFMQGLFEDKLASQSEALLQGKQLADIIASQGPDTTGEGGTDTASRSTSGVMSASQTGSGVVEPQKRPSLMVGALAMGLVLVAGVGGGYLWLARKSANEIAAVPTGEATNRGGLTRGAIAIASEPPGATIIVDGERWPDPTPATISKLTFDTPITIRLEKDGYEPLEKTVTLTEAEPSTALSLTMTKGVLTVEVGLKPMVPGASLVLDGKPHPRLTIEGVTAGDPHKLVVTAPGYSSQTFHFTGAIGEKKHFDASLVRLDPRAAARPEAPAPAPTGTGKLNVSARGGWCNVTVDGAGKGPTPVAGISLSAGPHTVTCTPEGGKPMTATVSVPPDGTARYSFTLTP